MNLVSIFLVATATMLLSNKHCDETRFPDKTGMLEKYSASISKVYAPTETGSEYFPGVFERVLVETPTVWAIECLRVPNTICAIWHKSSNEVALDPDGDNYIIENVKSVAEIASYPNSYELEITIDE